MAKKSNKFIYIAKTGRIKIRFVGEQVEMFQYFNKSHFNGTASLGAFGPAGSNNSYSEKSVFFREDDNGDEVYTRSKRIVSLVVDRSDEKIKAFVCPISVWNMITCYAKENDFEIWRTGYRFETRYFAEALGLSEISDEHTTIVSATLDSYSFADIFIKNEWEIVSEIVERIENRWEILDFSPMSEI